VQVRPVPTLPPAILAVCVARCHLSFAHYLPSEQVNIVINYDCLPDADSYLQMPTVTFTTSVVQVTSEQRVLPPRSNPARQINKSWLLFNHSSRLLCLSYLTALCGHPHLALQPPLDVLHMALAQIMLHMHARSFETHACLISCAHICFPLFMSMLIFTDFRAHASFI